MFQASTPVIGENFHNRSAELDQLTRSIAKLSAGVPQWLAILGPRKIGKTSLVLEATRRAESSSLHVVNLDIEEQSPASLEIFRRLALRVLDASFGVELGESLERLARKAPDYRGALQRSQRFAQLPATLRAEIIEIVEGEATAERIHGWLDLPERLAISLQLCFVIALDEFQELDALSRKDLNLFAQMRSIWQKHQRVAYFISGVGALDAARIGRGGGVAILSTFLNRGAGSFQLRRSDCTAEATSSREAFDSDFYRRKSRGNHRRKSVLPAAAR